MYYYIKGVNNFFAFAYYIKGLNNPKGEIERTFGEVVKIINNQLLKD